MKHPTVKRILQKPGLGDKSLRTSACNSRSWLPACALLGSLSFAAFVLYGQTVFGQEGEEDQVLAIINDYQLTMSDVNAQISQMPLGDQVSVRSNPEKFAESLIQEEVLFQYGLKDEIDNDSALRSEVKTLIVNHLIEKHVTQNLEVSEAEIQQYYDDNTGAIRGETVQVRHILTETLAECTALLERINQGESFAELAKEYSIHESSAVNGGEVGSMMNHEGPLGFERQLFEIPEDEFTLFESRDGCHIVSVNGRVTPNLPPIENVEDALRALLTQEKELAAVEQLIELAHNSIEVIRPDLPDEAAQADEAAE